MPPPVHAELRAFASAIRGIRARQRLSQASVGRCGGLGANYVGQIERAEFAPSFDGIVRLARGLDVPVSEVVRVYEERLAETLRTTLAQRLGARDTADLEGEGGEALRIARLRAARSIVRLIEDAYDIETAKAWLLGAPDLLDGRAPIEVLGAAVSAEQLEAVVEAADAFARSR